MECDCSHERDSSSQTAKFNEELQKTKMEMRCRGNNADEGGMDVDEIGNVKMNEYPIELVDDYAFNKMKTLKPGKVLEKQQQ
mmetsp:Transcript_3031/g.3253  ORF Transcript_3031/g.3253 Transcript_3031/m.3253 type:complete len:82 (-) Transcript_3031:620-865(-)